MATFPHGDPRLKSTEHVANRTYWRGEGKRSGLACARCHGAIDYDDRTQGPMSLVVGHIIERDAGGSDDLSNTQPECKACSDRSGGIYRGERNRIDKYTHTRDW